MWLGSDDGCIDGFNKRTNEGLKLGTIEGSEDGILLGFNKVKLIINQRFTCRKAFDTLHRSSNLHFQAWEDYVVRLNNAEDDDHH